MMKKLLLLIAVALLTSIATMAQPRSEQQAIQIAQDFFAKSTKKKAPKLSVVSQQKVTQQIRKKVAAAKKAPAQHSSCYIINDEANNRFVMVSADERMYQILGYSDNGCFEAEKAPEGLLELMNGYSLTYDSLLAHPEAKIRLRQAEAREVESLIKTKWDQDAPYNDLCPEDPTYAEYKKTFESLGYSTRGATGCIATAMAQVMNYYRYPQRGLGSISYKTRTLGIQQEMDFSKVEFDWSSMTDTYDESSTEKQKQAVARLMLACGNSVAMDYTFAGSGSNNFDLAYSLIHYFGYNPNVRHYEKKYFDSEEWLDLIYSDLENSRPVIYTSIGVQTDKDGNQSSAGHAFIIHGCDADGKFLINWGYSGKFDGYFELTALEFDNGNDNYNYSINQAMVCNIQPQSIGESEDRFFAGIFAHEDWLKGNKVGGYGQAELTEVYNYCVESNTYKTYFQGEIGLGLFDTKRNFMKSLDSESISMKAAYGRKEIDFFWQYDAATFKPGSRFIIAPYAKAKDSDHVTLIATELSAFNAYNAEVSEDGSIVVRPGIIIPDVKEGMYKVSAFDKEGIFQQWRMQVTKGDEASTYLINNLIPSESGIFIIAKQDETGNLVININEQELGRNLSLHNYSSTGNITIIVSDNGVLKEISDAWGLIDRATGDELSRYAHTEIVPDEPEPVAAPAIAIDQNHHMTITCSTEGASIYYTFTEKGEDPKVADEYLYKEGKTLDCNGIVKAIAVKDGVQSESTSREENRFKVATPEIIPNGNWFTIDCPTTPRKIYYTTDGSTPSYKEGKVENGTEYIEPFECNVTTKIQAIAVRERWHDSDIHTYYHVVNPEEADVVINNNIAGELPSRIAEGEKLGLNSLTITGKLNGTDIKFIREMLTDGKLAYLDIQNTDIVSGGEPYYKAGESELLWHYTEDDVIGSQMFSCNKNLVSIKLPNSVKTVGMYSLSNCNNLKDIALPERCKSILSNAISDCESLESVYIPAQVENINGTNFTDCGNLKSIEVDENNQHYKSWNNVLFTKDGSKLIKYPSGIESDTYVIPNGVDVISDHAFASTALENVQFPDGLKLIDNAAFTWCKKLKSVSLPNTVENVGMYAFSDCTELASVELSQMLKKINQSAFADCKNLREVSFGMNLKEIDGTAFSGCTLLTAYYVDEQNPYITAENGTLYSKDMTVLKSCPTALYTEVFYVPDGVQVIDDHAFSGCKNIGSIKLPESVVEFGNAAFSYCSLASINLPDGINEIPMFAFSDCKNLKSIILPSSLKEISTNAFSSCSSLEMVYIPESVDTIDSYAFSGCSSLKTIQCGIREIDKLGIHIDKYVNIGTYTSFLNIPDDCTWLVPFGPAGDENYYVNLYQAQPWWVKTWYIDTGDGINDLKNTNSKNDIWFTTQGTRLNHKPTQRGIYLHGGKKVMVK